VIRHTLSFGNDSDRLAFVRGERRERGSDMTKLRGLLGRFDRWTIEVFNPQHPLGRR
jgi:hypothetical protein